MTGLVKGADEWVRRVKMEGRNEAALHTPPNNSLSLIIGRREKVFASLMLFKIPLPLYVTDD